MILLLLSGRNYSAAIEGTAYKQVTCEKCGCEYVYQIARRTTGTASSAASLTLKRAQEKAHLRAQKNLRRELEKGVEVVPCPCCSRIQDHMFRMARATFRIWLRWAGTAAMVASPVVFAVSSILWLKRVSLAHLAMASACVLSLGLATFIYRAICAWLWDPNSSAQSVARFAAKATNRGVWTLSDFNAIMPWQTPQNDRPVLLPSDKKRLHGAPFQVQM